MWNGYRTTVIELKSSSNLLTKGRSLLYHTSGCHYVPVSQCLPAAESLGLLVEFTVAWSQFILGKWLQTHQSLEQRSSDLVTFMAPFSILRNNASCSMLQPTVHTGMPQTLLNLGVFKSVVLQIPLQRIWFDPLQQLLHWGKFLWLQSSFGSLRQKKQALCIWLRCSSLLLKLN